MTKLSDMTTEDLRAVISEIVVANRPSNFVEAEAQRREEREQAAARAALPPFVELPVDGPALAVLDREVDAKLRLQFSFVDRLSDGRTTVERVLWGPETVKRKPLREILAGGNTSRWEKGSHMDRLIEMLREREQLEQGRFARGERSTAPVSLDLALRSAFMRPPGAPRTSEPVHICTLESCW